MIGVPMANPRESIINNLNQQLDAFFGAGNKAEQVASGVSGEVGGPINSTRSIKLKAARDKDAPRPKELAEAGMSAIEAAKKTGTDSKRARLIAQENSFRLYSSPP
ncbi:hypothetical protein [Pseudomonas fluorescens]